MGMLNLLLHRFFVSSSDVSETEVRRIKFLRKFSLCFLSGVTVLFAAPLDNSFAADSRARFSASNYARQSEQFVTTPQLRGYVDFWKMIFAKYGENQQVFHFRDKPWVVYAVLDYSKFKQKYSGKEYERRKTKAGDQQTAEIRHSLQHLHAGNEPRNPFERRIQTMFKALEGNTKAHYKKALEDKQIRSQTGIKERFAKGISRSHRYLPAIEKIFSGEGLPLEVARLPLIESSFDYTARSSVGAAGVWQFMPATGRSYMRINSYIDERLDPILASRAAAKYLSHAYKRLGSWPLAVTSYNHGVTGVLRAANAIGSRDIYTIIKNYRSESFGFASSNFYVELLAAVDIERDHNRYFPGMPLEDPIHFDEVQLGRPEPFHVLLRASQMSKEEFLALNLAFLRPTVEGRAPVPSRFLLKVRHGTGAAVAKKLGHGKVYSLDGANLLYEQELVERKAETKTTSQGYTVKSGDTVGSIAQRFGVSSRELMAVNGISDPKKLRVGKAIKIPGSGTASKASSSTSKATTSSSSSAKTSASGSYYTVKSGDNLGAIAKKNGLKLNKLKELNPGVSTFIKPGQKLRVR